METFLHDLRYGVRTLLKSPGFTIVALLTLALGIGANTAIFSLVDTVLLRPLAYNDPGKIVTVSNDFKRQGFRHLPLSVPELDDMRSEGQVFQYVAAYAPLSTNLTGGGQPERIDTLEATADYFSVLGTEPRLGRTFQPSDEQPGITEIAVISSGLWQRRFGADPDIIGKKITLDNDDYTIIGVMPLEFRHPGSQPGSEVEVWVPRGFKVLPFNAPPVRGDRRLSIIARLKPSYSLEQAQAEMNTIASRLQRQYPDQYEEASGYGITLTPLHSEIVGNLRSSLLVLLGSVSFVLLIACTNVANLLLVRSTGRQKEMAVRAALGASRGRIVRQLLTESLLLSFSGGVIGFLLAFWGLRLLVRLSPVSIPRANEIGLNFTVLVFTMAISVLTGMIFGLFPSLQSSKADMNEALKEGGRGGTVGVRRSRARSLLAVAEFALALMLLVSAALLIRSFWRMQNVDPGFNPHNVLTLGTWLPFPNTPEKGVYTDGSRRMAFFQQLLRRVEQLPGVKSAGYISLPPLSRDKVDRIFTIEGREAQGRPDSLQAQARRISPNYFDTMGITLVAGRAFTDNDDAKSPPVAIINETTARRFWPGEDPVGKRIKMGRPQDNVPWWMIVGVAGDVKTMGLDTETPPEVYLSSHQGPAPLAMTLVVRTVTDPAGFASSVRDEVSAVDINQPVFNVKTMDELLSAASGQRRFLMTLLATFAVAALFLASVGLYGVISYSVTQRTHEIGIRLAMGAQRKDILRLVMGQGLKIALIGTALGLVASIIMTRALSGLLFGVSPVDLISFTLTPLVLSTVAVFASYLPGRRATRVDPIIALRHD
jgi:predicted permease